MISSLLDLVGLRIRVYYNLNIFLGGQSPLVLSPPPSIRQWYVIYTDYKELIEEKQCSQTTITYYIAFFTASEAGRAISHVYQDIHNLLIICDN